MPHAPSLESFQTWLPYRMTHRFPSFSLQGCVPEGSHVPGYGPAEAAPVMKDFSQRWTSAVEALNKWGSPHPRSLNVFVPLQRWDQGHQHGVLALSCHPAS